MTTECNITTIEKENC